MKQYLFNNVSIEQDVQLLEKYQDLFKKDREERENFILDKSVMNWLTEFNKERLLSEDEFKKEFPNKFSIGEFKCLIRYLSKENIGLKIRNLYYLRSLKPLIANPFSHLIFQIKIYRQRKKD
jgi:hypothetical protein